MNGQTARLEIARQLITSNRDFIVETGTYRGTTTEWFACFGIPVATVEISPRFYTFSKKRLSRFSNVKQYLGESTLHLKNMEAETARPFVYLDAHWENHLPLSEELKITFDRWPQAVVMVDDCQVKDDPAYTYDDYGPSKAITEYYIRSVGLKNLRYFMPSVPGRHETGARRGCAVLAVDNDVANRIGLCPLLRE